MDPATVVDRYYAAANACDEAALEQLLDPFVWDKHGDPSGGGAFAAANAKEWIDEVDSLHRQKEERGVTAETVSCCSA